MEDLIPPFTVGYHDTKAALPVTANLIRQAHGAGYSLVTSPITTPHFHSRVLTVLSNFLSQSSTRGGEEITSSYNASPVEIAPLGPDDTPLSPDESISQILAYTSPWIDLCSLDPVISDISRQVLRLELQYAAFCGITYVMISSPNLKASPSRVENVAKFARAILETLNLGPYMQILIWMPMTGANDGGSEQMGDLAPFARAQYIDGAPDARQTDLFGSWETWDRIRSLCRYSTRLSIALSIPRILPPMAVQSRWYAEPVRMLTLDASVFTRNPKGYPVLSKSHQALVSRSAHFKQPPSWLLLCNVGPIPLSDSNGNVDPNNVQIFPTLAESASAHQFKDPVPHLSYIRNLQTKQPTQSAADRFGAGYQDYLQAPLQPLTVNLESITYEVFEKDPIKYEWYERAVARALHDWIEQGKPTSNPDGRVVVAVVGAGRGPLVTRALQASEAVGVEIDLWALEKNPNAFVLLQRHNQGVWNQSVTLVKSDMRTWRGPVHQLGGSQTRKSYNLNPDEAPQGNPIKATEVRDTVVSDTSASNTQNTHYKIDILISELLGSFADNELSPECLDGVQHLLNPIHGISIPASYTAHITPISAPKLHADISLSMVNTMAHAAETPYVVMFNAIDFLSTTEGSTKSDPPGQSSPSKVNTTPARPQHQQSQSQSYSSAVQQKPIPVTQPSSNTINISATLDPIVHQTWAFHHPNPSLPSIFTTSSTATTAPSNAHNARYCNVSFPVPNRATCHGLAGYFETVLYPGVELSTNPLTMATKSEDMISWFPIYFPLKQPLYIPDQSVLTVQMWRQTDDRKVWYEWILDIYSTTVESQTDQKTGETVSIQKKMRIGGSELHSSEKEACLM